MKRQPKAYVAQLPAAALPELQDLLGRYQAHDAPRGNVVMMRLGDQALARLDQLVEAGLFGSRSEAAAFLVASGIDVHAELFRRIQRHTREIQRLRRELREAAVSALHAASKPKRRADSSRPRH